MPEIFFWDIQNPAVTLHSETSLCTIPEVRSRSYGNPTLRVEGERDRKVSL